jgi:hypothetical protein
MSPIADIGEARVMVCTSAGEHASVKHVNAVGIPVNVTSTRKNTMPNNNKHFEYEGVVVPILKYLNSLPNSKAINIHGSVFCERGTPDVIGSVQGRAVLFEAKRSQEEAPEAIQKWRMAEWRAAGAVAECVRSVEDVQKILKREGLM